MSSYKNKLNTSRWKRFADDVKRRDGYKCIQCGCKDNLQVHHKLYYQHRSPWDYTIDLLETLCGSCHKMKHENISIDTYVAKERSTFKELKRKERAKYRELYNKENIFVRGMTAAEIHKIMLEKLNICYDNRIENRI
jgi:5-methylcytosine-specific restriction endonuclease McrA